MQIIEMEKQEGTVQALMVFTPEELSAFARLIEQAQREEDARICEELAELNREKETDSMWQWMECAAAIRNSGGVA